MHSLKRGQLLLLALVGIGACASDGSTAPEAQSQVVVRAQVLGSTAGLVVEVSGPGISPTLLFNLDVGQDSVAADTISVPAGGGRRFVVTAVDTFGVATHRGDTTVALVAGVQRSLAMVLRPLSSSVGMTITLANAPIAAGMFGVEAGTRPAQRRATGIGRNGASHGRQ